VHAEGKRTQQERTSNSLSRLVRYYFLATTGPRGVIARGRSFGHDLQREDLFSLKCQFVTVFVRHPLQVLALILVELYLNL
jgi:hypothetical protein